VKNISADWTSPVLAALQPSYLPWLGAFEQFARSDIFVFYDDVQYDRDGWRNRNRIKTAQGTRWLTVPVQTRGKFGQRILDVKIDNRQAWARKHLQTLEQSYAKAPHLHSVMAELRAVLEQPWDSLVDLNITLFLQLARSIGLERRVRRSSELSLPDGKNERLLALCRMFGARTYYTGSSARDYLKEEFFQEAGIKVLWQNFQHPVYPQLHGDFVSHLSALDWLLNCPESERFIA